MSKQTKAPLEESRKKTCLVDSKGLIVDSWKDSLQHFRKPWAHEHEPVKNLLDAVKAIKPIVLIRSSRVGRAFIQEVVEAMASFNEDSEDDDDVSLAFEDRLKDILEVPYDQNKYEELLKVANVRMPIIRHINCGIGPVHI